MTNASSYPGDSLKYVQKNVYCDTNQKYYVKVSTNGAKKLDFIVGYIKEQDLYIVWNNLPHVLTSGILSGETHNYTLNWRTSRLKAEASKFETIRAVYKPLRSASCHEKVVLVKPCFIDQFCEHPFSYLMPDKNDPDFEPDTLYATPNMSTCVSARNLEKNKDFFVEEARKRYNCSRAERDYTFRKRVFAQYSPPHCIVCDITNQTVLQAAHIDPVSHTNDDSTENGIVLCANHHLMYDKGELEIDFFVQQGKIL